MSINTVCMEKAIATAGAKSSVFSVVGKYNLCITGTWVGTIKVLRRFKNLKALGVHTGLANASVLTHAQTGERYTTDALIGMWVSNDTKNEFALITGNTTTTITGTLSGSGDWDVSDAFSLWQAAGSYTANTDPQPEEVEAGVEYVIFASAWTSGTALVRISQ